MGQLHPGVAEGFGLDIELYLAELEVATVVAAAARGREYRAVGRFPNVKVDIAVVVDETLEARLVAEEIETSGGDLLRSARLFDVYSGPQISEGKKSLAYALEFGSAEGTLTDEQAHVQMDLVIGALKSRFGASIRGRDAAEGEEN
jgi:phenylalanyl-tRNA synthetase beta chain